MAFPVIVQSKGHELSLADHSLLPCPGEAEPSGLTAVWLRDPLPSGEESRLQRLPTSEISEILKTPTPPLSMKINDLDICSFQLCYPEHWE